MTAYSVSSYEILLKLTEINGLEKSYKRLMFWLYDYIVIWKALSPIRHLKDSSSCYPTVFSLPLFPPFDSLDR